MEIFTPQRGLENLWVQVKNENLPKKIENGQKMSQTNHCLKTIWKLLKKLKTFENKLKKLKTFENKLKKSYEKWGEIKKLRGKTFEKYVFKNVKKNLEKYFFNMRLFVGFSNTIHKYFI